MRRLALLAVLATTAAGCGGGAATSSTASAPRGLVPATPQQIQAYPGRFAGATVVVGAGMGHRLQAHAFTVAAGARQRTRLANKALLVVAKHVPAAKPGTILRIRGRVLLLRPGSARRQLPYAVDVAKLEPFDRRPVLVASAITVAR